MQVKKCKKCGTEFRAFNSFQKCPKCTPKKHTKRSKKSELLQLAQIVFNKWIRNRDEKEPCIACGKFANTYHASHFIPISKSGYLRFNEDNVHKSCVACNVDLNGNLEKYEHNLIKKIGKKRVENLIKISKEVVPHNYSNEDLKEIIKKYSIGG